MTTTKFGRLVTDALTICKLVRAFTDAMPSEDGSIPLLKVGYSANDNSYVVVLTDYQLAMLALTGFDMRGFSPQQEAAV